MTLLQTFHSITSITSRSRVQSPRRRCRQFNPRSSLSTQNSATMAGRHKPIRLPPLKTLRVHDPKRSVENPCIAIMSSVLGTFSSFPTLSPPGLVKIRQLTCDIACWASAGYNATGCAAVENQLRKCMDGPAPPPAPTNTINYHLARMSKHMTGPRKQK